MLKFLDEVCEKVYTVHHTSLLSSSSFFFFAPLPFFSSFPLSTFFFLFLFVPGSGKRRLRSKHCREFIPEEERQALRSKSLDNANCTSHSLLPSSPLFSPPFPPHPPEHRNGGYVNKRRPGPHRHCACGFFTFPLFLLFLTSLLSSLLTWFACDEHQESRDRGVRSSQLAA